MGIVYVIRNNINGKEYVGQTRQRMNRRYCQHCSAPNGLLTQAIKKYGRNNFTCISNEVPDELMNNLEVGLISILKTMAPNGYNLDTGGSKYKIPSELTRRKLSESHIGKHLSEEAKHKVSLANTGRVVSEQTRHRISIAHTGKKLSSEHKHKLALAKIGKPGNHRGMLHTDETKKKISLAGIGRIGYWKGIPRSDETKRKISETKKRRRIEH